MGMGRNVRAACGNYRPSTFGLQCGNYRPSGRLFCLSSVALRWCLCDVCLKPVPVPVPHLFLMYSLSQCSPPCGWTPHKYIPSSLYGLDTSVYSLPLCLCGCSMCVWGGDWVTGLSGCVTGCVYLVQDKVMGIQGSLRLRS